MHRAGYTRAFIVYSPSLGRFLSSDPLASSTLPDYRYVSNNPAIKVDPTGHEETFYVCERLVFGPGWARTVGCTHSDVFGDQSGLVYIGFTGPIEAPPASNPPLPLGQPGWTCFKLKKPPPATLAS